MRAQLIMLEEEMLALLLRSPEQFEVRYNVRIGSAAGVLHASAEMTLKLMQTTGVRHRWCGYLGVDPETRQVVGSCGFTNEPTTDGEVEIAYFTFPGYEGKGYASSMAEGLVDLALSDSAVTMVVAHTLPEESASTAVLKKVGFTLQGEHMDPEHGRVWKWVKNRVS